MTCSIMIILSFQSEIIIFAKPELLSRYRWCSMVSARSRICPKTDFRDQLLDSTYIPKLTWVNAQLLIFLLRAHHCMNCRLTTCGITTPSPYNIGPTTHCCGRHAHPPSTEPLTIFAHHNLSISITCPFFELYRCRIPAYTEETLRRKHPKSTLNFQNSNPVHNLLTKSTCSYALPSTQSV